MHFPNPFIVALAAASLVQVADGYQVPPPAKLWRKIIAIEYKSSTDWYVDPNTPGATRTTLSSQTASTGDQVDLGHYTDTGYDAVMSDMSKSVYLAPGKWMAFAGSSNGKCSGDELGAPDINSDCLTLQLVGNPKRQKCLRKHP